MWFTLQSNYVNLMHCSTARMKALLFTLFRAFEFELAVPTDMIEKRSLVVTRPFVKGDKPVAQLPLLVKACPSQ